MSDIPKDLRAVAEDVYYEAWLDVSRERSVQLIAEALMAERERAANVLQPWKRRDHLSLQCGEVTGQEFRTVRAVLSVCQAAIRSPETPTPRDET